MSQRTLALGFGLAGMIVGGLVASQVVSALDEAPAKPNLSVLGMPATKDDVLPPRARNSPSAADFADVDATRYVGNFKGANYYLTPGTRDRLCIVKAAPTSVTISCTDSSRLLNGHWLGTMDKRGVRSVVVVAPDGYQAGQTRDRKAPPKDVVPGKNVAFTTLSRAGGEVSLTGDGKRSITVKLPPLRVR